MRVFSLPPPTNPIRRDTVQILKLAIPRPSSSRTQSDACATNLDSDRYNARGVVATLPKGSSRGARAGDWVRGKGIAARRQITVIGTSPIWRSACQGAWVDRRCVGGRAACRVVAAREAVRAFAGFATFGHAHIRGLAQDLCSSHLRRLKSSAPTGVGAQATNRGVVCASRE